MVSQITKGKQMQTTKHSCGGPIFGRKTAGCPRCDELIGGAKPVVWNFSRRYSDAMRVREIRAQSCAASRCGVCTFGDW